MDKKKSRTHPAYDWGVAAVIAERVRPLTSNSTRVGCDGEQRAVEEKITILPGLAGSTGREEGALRCEPASV